MWDLKLQYVKNSKKINGRKEQTTRFRNWTKCLTKHFVAKDEQKASEHMKRCPTSLAISKM